jgi:hypothetical protein
MSKQLPPPPQTPPSKLLLCKTLGKNKQAHEYQNQVNENHEKEQNTTEQTNMISQTMAKEPVKSRHSLRGHCFCRFRFFLMVSAAFILVFMFLHGFDTSLGYHTCSCPFSGSKWFDSSTKADQTHSRNGLTHAQAGQAHLRNGSDSCTEAGQTHSSHDSCKAFQHRIKKS